MEKFIDFFASAFRGGSMAKKKSLSKKLAVWAAVMATSAFIAFCIFGAFELDTPAELAADMFKFSLGYIAIYAGKSAFEKNSRNKYGLDEEGHPYNNEGGYIDE